MYETGDSPKLHQAASILAYDQTHWTPNGRRGMALKLSHVTGIGLQDVPTSYIGPRSAGVLFSGYHPLDSTPARPSTVLYTVYTVLYWACARTVQAHHPMYPS